SGRARYGITRRPLSSPGNPSSRHAASAPSASSRADAPQRGRAMTSGTLHTSLPAPGAGTRLLGNKLLDSQLVVKLLLRKRSARYDSGRDERGTKGPEQGRAPKGLDSRAMSRRRLRRARSVGG